MYHLLTGKSPYEPPYEFVPARRLVSNLAHGTEYILSKCVQMEPEARYQSIDELLNDLNHIYKFDKAYQKYQTAKKLRVVIVAGMLTASVGLMVGGQVVLEREKEAKYVSLLSLASESYTSDFSASLDFLNEARELYPERLEANRQQTYALYLNGKWQECIDYGTVTLKQYGEDGQTRVTVASAQFELGAYEEATQNFYQGSQVTELSMDHMRDYAVCLGRMGEIEEAEEILEDLIGKGANPDITQYVQGEVYLAQEDYLQAESAFLSTLQQTKNSGLTRRCYISLGDLYRNCAALLRVNASPIEYPATKSAQLLSSAVVQEGLRYDSIIWEMLALAYFEAYHTDPAVTQDYLAKAAECFEYVIELGMIKEYLYSNLYTIYYEQEDYDKAEQALTAYEEMFPDDYMPHALRGMMLITMENQKAQNLRDYHPAQKEYEIAGSMIRTSDETTYYQQLGSLIENLKKHGWL